MKSLNHLGIAARLALSFGLLIVLLIVGAGWGYWQQRVSEREMQQLIHGDMAHLRLVDRWAGLSRETTVRIMAVNKSSDAAVAKMFGPEIGPMVKQVGEFFRQIKDAARTPEELAWFEQMTPRRERLLKALADMGEARKQGDLARASELFDSAFLPAQQAYNEHIAAFAVTQQQLLDQRVRALSDTRHQQAVLLLVAALGLCAVGIFLAVTVSRHIKRSVDSAVTLAEAVAGGNLTVEPRIEGRDEFAALMRSLAHMTQALRDIVAQVRQGTDSIAHASTEIAQGNIDLSQRTEQQAGSLQQAASAMDELTVSVQRNADHARQANQLAETASQVAQAGGEAVARVVNTMGEIDTASRRIEEITGVIDGISFQTNILALNAAVEAARAGEQGRGFAVVAGEVRTLAQRSAQAAKEIKELIANSSDKVRMGSEQVQGAGKTMAEIVQSVMQVSVLVSEISHATAEQGSGIVNVGQSVNEIDQATQQNAALVEQAAAAADAMRQQAQSLEQAVSVFKLAR